MILVESKNEIEAWLKANRLDKESHKPYCIATEVDGGYELPDDSFIEKGLEELEIPYSIVRNIKGVSVEIESMYFNLGLT